jgi:hypothetical protein
MPNLAPVPQLAPTVHPTRFVTVEWFTWLNTLRDILERLNGQVLTGTGTPAGVVIADRGTLFLRTDGGAGTTLYVKEGNDGTFNGWAAK